MKQTLEKALLEMDEQFKTLRRSLDNMETEMMLLKNKLKENGVNM